MNIKLNVLLAKTDTLAAYFKAMMKDYGRFFNRSQGAFIGETRTYTPREGTIDEPSKRGNVLVQTTVQEKFEYFIKNSSDYIKSLFSQEKTNASGNAQAELIVEGDNWGIYTSLELLRLKSLLETPAFMEMINEVPVRSDSVQWKQSENEMYSERAGIFETPLVEEVVKTTIKESYILTDPNAGEGRNYTPQIAVKTTVAELGDYTRQQFTGELSQRQKAKILSKRSILYTSVITALKVANETEVVESDLTAEKIYGYILNVD